MFSHRRNRAPETLHPTPLNPGRTRAKKGVPPLGTTPDDFRACFDYLYNLIQSSVVDQLELIFAHVREIEASAAKQLTSSRRAIRLPDVLDMVGISKSSLYSRINPASPYYDESMPKPFKLGQSRNADRAPSVWWEDEWLAYLETCSDVSRRRS